MRRNDRSPRNVPARALAWAASLALAASGCSWFAGSTPTDAPTEEPPQAPTCRPASAELTRGEIPFKEGATTPGGWKITKVDAEIFERVLVTYAKDGAEVKLEVKYNDGGSADWSTTDYRLMPAEGQADPPADLLNEVMGQLRAWQTEQKQPFVRKVKDVVDPYDGLPPCGDDGKPM